MVQGTDYCMNIFDRSCHALFFPRTKSCQKQSIATMQLKLPNPYFPASTEFNSVCAVLWVVELFSALELLAHIRNVATISTTAFMVDIRANYKPWFHQSRPSHIRLIRPRTLSCLILIPFVFYWLGYSSTQRALFHYGIDSLLDVSFNHYYLKLTNLIKSRVNSPTLSS